MSESKELMLKEAYKKWGVDYINNNLCDAYCLSRFCFENNKVKNNE